MISPASREAPTLMLFIATAKPTEVNSSLSAWAHAKRRRPSSVLAAHELQHAGGFGDAQRPGRRDIRAPFACARTKFCARASALLATPNQTALHRDARLRASTAPRFRRTASAGFARQALPPRAGNP